MNYIEKRETYQLRISDLTIDVVKKSIKNIYLTVYPPAGRVRITAPLRTTDKTIRQFALSRTNWINKHRLKFNNRVWQSKPKYISGENHYFKGKPYLLEIFFHHAPAKVEIPDHSHIFLYLRRGSTREKRESVMTEWYRAELKKDTLLLLEKWQKIIGVPVDNWGVKRMKTRWGSCNVKMRRIWLNLELAKKPPCCLEYIVVHEMVHLVERGHTKQFKLYMDSFIPPWRHYKKELNQPALN